MKDLFIALLIMGIVWLCRFIDWRERREQRYLALSQDW
jgi:hypothetical protein